MKVVAKDRNGIPRVWGEGSTTDEALKECITALDEYNSAKIDAGGNKWYYNRSSFNLELAN